MQMGAGGSAPEVPDNSLQGTGESTVSATVDLSADATAPSERPRSVARRLCRTADEPAHDASERARQFDVQRVVHALRV